jgi:hypothetical protein
MSEQCAYTIYTDRCNGPAIQGQIYCASCVRRFAREAKKKVADLEHDLAQAEDNLNAWIRMLPERKT